MPRQLSGPDSQPIQSEPTDPRTVPDANQTNGPEVDPRWASMWQRDNYENRQVRKSRLVDSIYDITIHLSAETRGDSDHIFVESAREQARRVGPYSYNPGIASSPSTAQQPAVSQEMRRRMGKDADTMPEHLTF